MHAADKVSFFVLPYMVYQMYGSLLGVSLLVGGRIGYLIEE